MSAGANMIAARDEACQTSRLLPGVAPLRPYVVLPAGGCDLDDVIRESIVAALEDTEWVQADAARVLRMTPRRINYQIHRLGIRPPAGRWTHGGPRRSKAREARNRERGVTDGATRG